MRAATVWCPVRVDHVVVVFRRPRPEGPHSEARLPFAGGAREAIDTVQALAGERGAGEDAANGGRWSADAASGTSGRWTDAARTCGRARAS
ncbi:hypothetical protein [Streptomyces sp. NPDC093991]|uniref:hypothetical protein n=1 Tax=unclassified Streptomyces TaxID=2593676 RepID=UPI003417765B